MLELRQKSSELSAFENRSQNLISHTLKKQIQRIITLNFTTFFLVFQVLKFYTDSSNPMLSQPSTGFIAYQNIIS